MDKKQAEYFVDAMMSDTCVGVDQNGNEFYGAPVSPTLKSFVIGYLGDNAPENLYHATRGAPHKGRALAELLREVADHLAPAPEAKS